MSVPTNKTVSSISQYPLHTARVYFTEKGLLAQQSVAAAAAYATAAGNSASSAGSSASSAAASASTSATSAANAAALYATFHNVYYGASATPPATRPDGSARQGGDMYYQSVNISGGARTGLQLWSANESGVFDWVPSVATPEIIDDRVASLLKPGANIGLSYNDFDNTLTIASSVTSTMAGEGFRNFYNNIQAAQLAHIPPEIKCIALMGASRPGDAGSPMICERRNGPITIHKGWLRSSDRYKLASNPGDAEDNTNGGYWEFVRNISGVEPEWFGAKADYLLTPPGRDGISYRNPTPTDSTQAIIDASLFAVYSVRAAIHPGTHYGWSAGPTILLGLGAYYVTSTITFGISVVLRAIGMGDYHDNANTRIYVPAGVTPFRFLATLSSYNDAAGNAGSQLLNIYMESEGGPGGPAVPGIIGQGFFRMIGCSVTGFGGVGVDLTADTNAGTASNLFYIAQSAIYNNGGDGILIVGGDANAGTIFANNISHNGGMGVRDNSFLGNFIMCNHFNSNALGAFYLAGSNNRTGVFANYVEQVGPPNYVGSNCVSMGGYVANGYRNDSEGFIYADGGISQHRIDYRGGEVSSVRQIYWTRDRPYSLHTTQFTIPGSGWSHHWRAEPNEGVFAWHWGDTLHSQLTAYTVTTEHRKVPAGRTESLPPARVCFPTGIFLGGDPSDLTTGIRFFGIVDHYINEIAIWGSGMKRHPGPWARGDTTINGGLEPSFAGNHWGEYCVVAGAHMTDGLLWVSGSNYGAGDAYGMASSYVKNSAGRRYHCIGQPDPYHSSTSQPTHDDTTGSPLGVVTYPDGFTWKWIANNEPVFKRFGPLMGDYVVTANDPIFNVWQTWNNAAVPFVGHRTDITDTASHPDSMLEEWCVGNTRKASIRKDGVFLSNGSPVVMATELDELRATLTTLQDRVAALETTLH